ncbi:YHS domain-containing protein [Candidatus Uhrbacteria bacterium]|nr:YHS domain-containing protein [Candidatus Uhrbacteria bacterium]
MESALEVPYEAWMDACSVCFAPLAALPAVFVEEVGGERYAFCSETCRNEFLQAPDTYLKPAADEAEGAE